MSFDTITIYRDFQVVDGYVQVPNNLESDKRRVTRDEALAAVTGSDVIELSGSGKNTGRSYGRQEIFRLPGITPDAWYESDPVDDL